MGILPDATSIMRPMGAVPFKSKDKCKGCWRNRIITAFVHFDRDRIGPSPGKAAKAAWSNPHPILDVAPA